MSLSSLSVTVSAMCGPAGRVGTARRDLIGAWWPGVTTARRLSPWMVTGSPRGGRLVVPPGAAMRLSICPLSIPVGVVLLGDGASHVAFRR